MQESGKEQKFGFDYSYWSHDGFIEPEAKMGYLNAQPGSKYIDQNKVFSDLVSFLSLTLLNEFFDKKNRSSFCLSLFMVGIQIGYGSAK